MKLFSASFLYGFLGLYALLVLLLLYGIGSGSAEYHLFTCSMSYSGVALCFFFILFHLLVPVLAFVYLADKHIKERNGN